MSSTRERFANLTSRVVHTSGSFFKSPSDFFKWRRYVAGEVSFWRLCVMHWVLVVKRSLRSTSLSLRICRAVGVDHVSRRRFRCPNGSGIGRCDIGYGNFFLIHRWAGVSVTQVATEAQHYQPRRDGQPHPASTTVREHRLVPHAADGAGASHQGGGTARTGAVEHDRRRPRAQPHAADGRGGSCGTRPQRQGARPSVSCWEISGGWRI